MSLLIRLCLTLFIISYKLFIDTQLVYVQEPCEELRYNKNQNRSGYCTHGTYSLMETDNLLTLWQGFDSSTVIDSFRIREKGKKLEMTYRETSHLLSSPTPTFLLTPEPFGAWYCHLDVSKSAQYPPRLCTPDKQNTADPRSCPLVFFQPISQMRNVLSIFGTSLSFISHDQSVPNPISFLSWMSHSYTSLLPSS